MGSKKRKGSHQGLPKGMTYADKLAYQRAKERAIEEVASSTLLKVHSNMHAQRVMWLCLVSMADAFGFGPARIRKFVEQVEANSLEVERMKNEVDEEYAWEKLRLRAQAVAGAELEYLYEKEVIANAKKKRQSGGAGDP